MVNKYSKKFNKLFDRAKTDPNIIGFFLVGSRGKGFENENSDYDSKMIVSDKATEKLKREFKDKKN